MSVNKVIIVGNLGKDPESRSFQNGGKVVSLSVATSETWKDRNTGERKERVDWHNVSLFAEPAVNFAEQYLRKGSKVYIEGQLETRKWQDQAGQDRYTTEVVVRPYRGQTMGLDAPAGSGDRRATTPGSTTPHDRGATSAAVTQERELEDEIPF